jgi:DNA-binding XRE family transcriptional regulator/phage-related protein|tara:strand:- start:76 stop:648 length:573 start_codon:yes stop_codon:yes gene_type:complete
MEVYFFDKKIEKFIDSRDLATQTRIGRMIKLLQKYGNQIGSYFGSYYSKKVSKGLFEIRIKGNIEVRIFYTFRKQKIYLLHGFVKKSQKIPKRELEINTIMKSFNQYLKEKMKDPEYKKQYDALESEFAIIEGVIKKRLENKMTQAQLAKKVGTTQSAIARLESGTYNPSFSMLRKVADALDAKLTISLT